MMVWNSLTFKCETSINNQKKRGWCIDTNVGLVAIGHDEGLVVLGFSQEANDVITVDANGRAYWARNNEVQSASLNQAVDAGDGQPVDCIAKDVATSEFCPSSIAYNSTGRYIAICGDNEYSICSALAWRSKAYGEAREIVWGIGDTYAVRVSGDRIQIHTAFSNVTDFSAPYECDRIFGGMLLGVASDDVVTFYTWTELTVVRQIDVRARAVWWSPASPLVAIATSDNLYILSFNDNFMNAADYNAAVGSAEAFNLVADREQKVKKGFWYNEVFFFNDDRTVYFFAGGHFEVIARYDGSLNLVGYVPRNERLFLADRSYNFYSYSVPATVLDFVLQATSEGDVDAASVPPEWKARMCTLLEGLGLVREALQLADNDEKRFDLAIKLNDVDSAVEIARASGSSQQWRHLASVAMRAGRLPPLEEALTRAGDESGLLLVMACRGDAGEMAALAAQNEEHSKNASFAAYFATGNYSKCIDILLATGKAPDAAMMARAYVPARMGECAERWKEMLVAKGDRRRAEAIATPQEFPNLFGIDPEKEKPETEPPEDEDLEALLEGIDEGDESLTGLADDLRE
jgi:coatomer subunit beta'